MPIPDDDPMLDEQTERELAKRLFNMVWSLLEQPSRTADEDELMLNAAHASRFAAIAKTAADRIEDAEDREIFLGDLADLPLNR